MARSGPTVAEFEALRAHVAALQVEVQQQAELIHDVMELGGVTPEAVQQLQARRQEAQQQGQHRRQQAAHLHPLLPPVGERPQRCVQSGCDSFANWKKQGYCNAHATSLGINEAAFEDFLIPEVRALCNANDNAFTGEWIPFNGIELPAPFTRIANRTPVVGDCVVTRVDIGGWMSNSKGSVFEVHEDAQIAYIHLGYNDWAPLSFDSFVICER